MQRLSAEADSTLRRIREFAVREELKMGDDLDSGTLPTTIPDLLRRVLQKFGRCAGKDENQKMCRFGVGMAGRNRQGPETGHM